MKRQPYSAVNCDDPVDYLARSAHSGGVQPLSDSVRQNHCGSFTLIVEVGFTGQVFTISINGSVIR